MPTQRFQDAGEVGKAGVTVELYTCVDEGCRARWSACKVTDAGSLLASAAWCRATASSKVHRRRRLGAHHRQRGRRRLRFGRGCGRLLPQLLHTLLSGETIDTVDAGFSETASINDKVWVDSNANAACRTQAKWARPAAAVELYLCR
ncbi:MAG: hypothetical protein KF710_01805 [Rhodocyclaceae bacterium]|nr:hypothetical protein [Rhodocyclaceae bacterium]